MTSRDNRVAKWYFGGVASAGAACCTHPLDLLKVHLQTTSRAKLNAGTPSPQVGLVANTLIIEITESPLFLKLNPTTRHTGLPIKLYESVIDLVNGLATMLFVDIPFNLATEEAERIGLDHMARMTATTQSGQMANSLVAEHLRVQYSAVKMLRDRVRLILDYVRDIRNDSVEWNHEILRETFNLCHRLPVLSSDKFSQDFYNQCNDVALMTYLGMLTKGSNTVNQFVNKFNILYDRQGMGRRMRGLFF
ncbi:unnamed protein product [Medioppia subpectinata]|uniref:COP9 signalosome complex subunit 6 n=1 Tax=Medioppia subpectinata TaxID=1979941 RepID=A0A7R9KM93_9ACAR|nr:unnamed protein product [Medioppia subpectinata]CAG2105114.1 unnamed protein product [Medioppia subpectinata]